MNYRREYQKLKALAIILLGLFLIFQAVIILTH